MQYIIISLGLLAISACVPVTIPTTPSSQDLTSQDTSSQSPSSQDPTQLGARQIEIRTLDVPYELAYRAATQALFSLGYSIDHSDKVSGILTGSRMVGVANMKIQIEKAKEEARQYQERAQQEQTARTVIGVVPYVGWLAHLLPGSQPPKPADIQQPSGLQITMLLQPLGEKRTQIRFKMQKDGEPIWDQVTIDRLWVTTQREAMIESGPPAANASTSNSPAEKVDEPTTK